MERYFTFPGTGDGISVLAKAVDMDCLGVFADPDKVTVMRTDLNGDWVKFDDALQRSRQEFDKGKAEGAKVAVCASEILTAYQDGLKVGKAQGQAKLDAYKQASLLEPSIALGGVYLERLTSGDVAVRGLLDTDFVGYAGDLGILRVSTLRKHAEAQRCVRLTAHATDPTFEVAPSHLNRLLNELYHDRARLEKTIQEFVDVAEETSDDVGELAEVLETLPNANQVLKDQVHNLQICATALGVYVDLFGDKG